MVISLVIFVSKLLVIDMLIDTTYSELHIGSMERVVM